MPKQERDARIAQRSPVLAQHMGLVFRGTVTTATDATHFKVSALPEYGDPADFPNAMFKGYYVYVLWDAGGAGAAPQGESKLISAYTSSDGTVTHTAFTVPLAVGDEVLLIHPDAYNAAVLADVGDASASLLGSLYGILGNPTQSFDTNLNISATEKLKDFIAKTGGTALPAGASMYGELGGTGFVKATDSLRVIAADVAEILDMTVTTATISVLVTETVLFEDASPSITINGISLKIDMTTMIVGDTCIIREYYKNLNGDYRQVSDNAANTFVGAQTPVMKIVGLEAYRYGCKITAQVDVATRAMPIEVIREA